MKKIILLSLTGLLWNCFLLQAEERNLLSSLTDGINIRELLLPGDSWIPFPAYADREAWHMIPENLREEMIRRGEEALDFAWDIVKATDYLEFVQSGDRGIMQEPLGARQSALQNLVLAELAEGEGRFLDQIINGIWALSEQTSWSLSAHMYLQKAGYGLPDVGEPVIDLTTGEISSLFSWTHYFLEDAFDQVDTLIARRIRFEIRNRVLDVYDGRDDFWWMGFQDENVNNWNVWVNHNMLATILLMEEDPERKARNVFKTMRSVDEFINYYKPDGGCDEGPSYWGHAGGALFEYLELLQMGTDGKIDIFDQEIIRNIGRYICKAQIAYPYVINFADASARSGGRPGVIYRYGKSIQDTVMMAFGAFLAGKAGWGDKMPGGNLEATLANLFQLEEIRQAKAREPLIGDFYLPDLQVCGARDSGGSAGGFFFAAKGGHNQESHNHNDVGNFILYYNGLPAIIDVGVGTYTRQTFSPDRWKIWTMQSQYHNTPTINGVQQEPGGQFRAENVAFDRRGREVWFQCDIAGAYPEEAMVHNWYRTIRFRRGNSLTVTEEFLLEKRQGATTLNFMTSLTPEKGPEGLVRLQGDGFTLLLEYDRKRTELDVEKKEIRDPRLTGIWGKVVHRLVFTYTGDRLADKLGFVITAQ
jgi:hypothetical protein